jgi:hypothetical protein
LASAALCDAFAAAGLTGLHVGVAANTYYSPEASVRASLGELAAKEIPEFRIVRPHSVVEIASTDGTDDGIGVGDDIRYWDWSGDDFSRSAWGPIVSEQALGVIRHHRTDGCAFWQIRAR